MFDSELESKQHHDGGSERPWSGIVDLVRSMNYGETVSTSALYSAVGIDDAPSRRHGETDRAFTKRIKRNALQFAGLLRGARRELLTNHDRDLRSARAGEYMLMLPSQQAGQAQRDALREARRALHVGSLRARHVARHMVGDADAARAADLEAHMDSLRRMMRSKK